MTPFPMTTSRSRSSGRQRRRGQRDHYPSTCTLIRTSPLMPIMSSPPTGHDPLKAFTHDRLLRGRFSFFWGSIMELDLTPMFIQLVPESSGENGGVAR